MPTLLRSLLLGCAALVMIGCNDEIVGQRSCDTDDDCLKIAGTVYNSDSGLGNPPQCCAKVCVIPVPAFTGCDSNYRYLTSLPGYGACVAEPMCTAGGDNDLSVTVDMAGTNTD